MLQGLKRKKPWAKLRLTKQYETARPWAKSGMSRQRWEGLVLLMPAGFVDACYRKAMLNSWWK